MRARRREYTASLRTHLLYDTHVGKPLIAGAVDGGQSVQRDLMKTEWGRSRMLRSGRLEVVEASLRLEATNGKRTARTRSSTPLHNLILVPTIYLYHCAPFLARLLLRSLCLRRAVHHTAGCHAIHRPYILMQRQAMSMNPKLTGPFGRSLSQQTLLQVTPFPIASKLATRTHTPLPPARSVLLPLIRFLRPMCPNTPRSTMTSTPNSCSGIDLGPKRIPGMILTATTFTEALVS